MYVAFYISSHGFGHMTRCLSLIENILKNSEYNIYIVCDKKQNDFARIYLSKFKNRIIYKNIVNDIGFINKKNKLEVDTALLKLKLGDFILRIDDIVKIEYEFLRKLDVKCIVVDISIIDCIIGNKLKLPTIFVSNFSWVEQYEHIGLDDYTINKFREAYSYIDKFIKYDLCMHINSIDTKKAHEVGFVCRDIDKVKVNNIKKKYGESIFITCGKSASLNSININNFMGTVFTTSGIDINYSSYCKLVKLPVDILDTQNYIAASSIVITKAGWSTIAEGILSHTGLVLVERPSAKEDSFNIECIKSRKLGVSISESDLVNIDISKLKEMLSNNVENEVLKSYKNDCNHVVDLILEGDRNEKTCKKSNYTCCWAWNQIFTSNKVSTKRDVTYSGQANFTIHNRRSC